MNIFKYFKTNIVKHASQFVNLVVAMNKRTEPEILEEAAERDKVINVIPPFSERKRYLDYCISFLGGKPLHKKLLELRIAGASNKQIAYYFRKNGCTSVTEQAVKDMEKDALKWAMDAIASKTRTGVPLFGAT